MVIGARWIKIPPKYTFRPAFQSRFDPAVLQGRRQESGAAAPVPTNTLMMGPAG